MKKIKLVPVLLILFMCVFSKRVYANSYNLEVKYDGNNISMTSKDTEMGFDLNNLLPGESDTSTINIRNTGNKSVSLQTNIEIKEDNGLLQMIDLSIKNEANKEIYSGKYTDLRTIYKVIPANGSEVYTITTSMNVNAGNEYQNKNYKIKFNFTATTDTTPIGTLTVKYVDEDGIDIIPSEVETKETTETYELPEQGREIEGYEFVEVEGDLTGNYKEEGTVVTYKYKKIKAEQQKGNVIILCVDENNYIIKRAVHTEFVGVEYDFGDVGEEIDGYEFVGVEGPTSGKYRAEDTYIIYKYKRKGQTTSTVSPKAGDKMVLYLILISCMAGTLSVILIWKIKNDKKKEE